MSDTFKDREKSFEAKFKLDEELKFKAESRRNKLLGLWAAEKMGLTASEAEAYATSVVVADMDEPGTEDVVRFVMKGFEDNGVDLSADDVRAELDRQMGRAVEQLKSEYPDALGKDHG